MHPFIRGWCGISSIRAPLFLPLLRLGAPFGLLLRLLGLRIFLNQLRGGHSQRRIILQPSLYRLVVNGIGIELLLNPLCQPHLLDAFDVAGPRAVSQPVQRVQNRFVRAELRNWQSLERGILFRLFVFGGGFRRGGYW